MKQVYTIGHSIYKIEDFVKLLQNNNINTIVDVRSIPYSKFAPQYNKEVLKQYLKQNAICYIFMGDTLGARYEDKSLLFDDGKVNFKKVQETKNFQDGIVRLERGIEKGYNISLMCSEKEAFDCHRFGLISEFLSKISININHIYPDKVIPHKDLEQKLLKKYEKYISQIDLFNPNINLEQQLKEAYKLRNKDIAYNGFTQEGDNE
ncbi:MAG: hypothetical protein KN64_09825 [Sulfurovum sp. AS07-7]|nr:MAG: hypothetical protein KN64_09825 [Sulfurovum sp. AS07-7]